MTDEALPMENSRRGVVQSWENVPRAPMIMMLYFYTRFIVAGVDCCRTTSTTSTRVSRTFIDFIVIFSIRLRELSARSSLLISC